MIYVFRSRIVRQLARVFDICGGVLCRVRPPAKVPLPNKVKKILIVRLDHVGDVVDSTPLIRSVKHHFRDAEITCLVGSWAADIVRNNPHVAHVIEYDAPWFARQSYCRKPANLLRGFVSVVELLKKRRFDLGFDPRGDVRHILLLRAAGVCYTVGYGITAGGFLLNACGTYDRRLPAVERNLALLPLLGVTPEAKACEVFVSDEQARWLAQFLRAQAIKQVDRYIVIHPCAGASAKNWFPQRWKAIAAKVNAALLQKIIFVGTAADAREIESMLPEPGSPEYINAAGKTTLANLIALIKRSSLFLGVDSGPSHIAACFGVPSVIVYSGTNHPGEWAARHPLSSVIQKAVACMGCEKASCRTAACMAGISVEEVWQRVKDMAAIQEE